MAGSLCCLGCILGYMSQACSKKADFRKCSLFRTGFCRILSPSEKDLGDVDPDPGETDPAADPEIFEEPTAAVLICPAGVVPLCKLPYHGLI